LALVLAALSLLLTPGTTSADGPFEPNETPAEAPMLVGAAVAAGFETPQDVDWYRFYALPHRQVGLLATLTGTCTRSTGTIRVTLLDGDLPGFRAQLAAVSVGWDAFSTTAVPKLADRLAVTTEAGHRYFVKVQNFGCDGATYGLELMPRQNLSVTLRDTTACSLAKFRARSSRRRLFGLRAASKRARGARRRRLRTRAGLQGQQVKVDATAAAAACSRPALTAYPFA
jgi:hypothetical protein